MEENRQALFERLDTDVKTNVGRIPAPDYLEMRAGEYGYDSYAEMYEVGYRIAGYEKVSPKVIEEWHRQKEQARPSLKERLAREQANAPLDVSAKYSCGFSNLMNFSMIVNGR